MSVEGFYPPAITSGIWNNTTTSCSGTTDYCFYQPKTEYQLLQECVSLLKEIIGILKKKKKGRKR